MKSVKWSLRIASIIMLLHAVGHTIGIASWKNTSSKVPQEVIKSMMDSNFDFNGAPGNMAKFYDGMGYASTIALLLVTALLWIVSGQQANSKFSKAILIPVALFLLLLCILELIYFFPMAAAFSFASTVLTLFAIFTLKE